MMLTGVTSDLTKWAGEDILFTETDTSIVLSFRPRSLRRSRASFCLIRNAL